MSKNYNPLTQYPSGEHKNWNQRPLVEFVIKFGKVMPPSSKITCRQLLGLELKELDNDLKLFTKYPTGMEPYIAQWEIRQDTHRFALPLIS